VLLFVFVCSLHIPSGLQPAEKGAAVVDRHFLFICQTGELFLKHQKPRGTKKSKPQV
jgi:hypothetical protein